MSNKKNISFLLILDLYLQNKNVAEIAEELNCGISNISNRLKKAGYIIQRDYSKTRYRRQGRYRINLDFFKNISTEELAYFLGMMFSDGSVTAEKFYLKLKDEDVIIKFKKALNAEQPIAYYKVPYISYKIEVCSKEMCSDLISLGCIPNKTRIIRFPSIPEHLYNHFIRGFIDGDGCIRVGYNLGSCLLNITSASYNFLLDLQNILLKYATHICISKEAKYDVWHLSCGGRQVVDILDWMYKDSTVYMDRKYFKYLLIRSLKTG